MKPVLKFHTVHAKNIKREQGGSRVVRKAWGWDGIVFSNRPISIDERVCIRQSVVSSEWQGVLRFGVTSVDPDAHVIEELPQSACPELDGKPGYWVRELPEECVSQGSLVQFYVSANGHIHYGVDGANKGIFLTGIRSSSPLWVIVDVYGTAKAIEFVSPRVDVKVPVISPQRDFASFASALRGVPPSHSPAPTPSSPWEAQSPMTSSSTTVTRSHPIAPVSPVQATSSTSASRPLPKQTTSSSSTTVSRKNPIAPVSPVQTTSSTSASRPSLKQMTSPSPASLSDQKASSMITTANAQTPMTSPSTTPHCIQTPPDSAPSLPITVHEVHGRSVKRMPASLVTSLSCTRAERTKDVSPNMSELVFSNRSISIGEWVHFRQWKFRVEGPTRMRFGVTSVDPASYKSDDLFKFVDVNKKTACWIRMLSKSCAWDGSVIQFFVSADGTIRYSIDGEDKAVFLSGVNTSKPLWVIVDVHGTAEAVEFVSEKGATHAVHNMRAKRGLPKLEESSPATGTSTDQMQMTSSLKASRSDQKTPGQVASSTIATSNAQTQTTSPMRDFRPKDDCSICMEAGVDAVIYTCGHMCMCYECAVKIKKAGSDCPICRKPIRDVIKTFKA